MRTYDGSRSVAGTFGNFDEFGPYVLRKSRRVTGTCGIVECVSTTDFDTCLSVDV